MRLFPDLNRQCVPHIGAFRKSGRFDRLALCASDLVAFTLAFVFAGILLGGRHFVRLQDTALSWPAESHLQLTLYLVLSLAGIGWFWFSGQYERRRLCLDEFPDTVKVIVTLGGMNAALLFSAKSDFSRPWFVATWVLALALVPLMRRQAKLALVSVGRWVKPVAVIGIGQHARSVAEALHRHPILGLRVVVFLVPPESWLKTPLEADARSTGDILVLGQHSIPVYRLSESPRHMLASLGDPFVVVALESFDCSEVSKLVYGCDLAPLNLYVAPPLRGVPLMGTEITSIFREDTFLIRVRNNLAQRNPQRLKRAFDLVAGATSLVLLGPLLLFIAWQIRRGGGPAFFAHRRIGQYGEMFDCYKFRTMVPNAEEVLQRVLDTDPEARREWAVGCKLKRDPRVTRIGAFLRRTSLDEVPQLWNVLKGEMSLVGPRPITPREVERYEDKYIFYLEAKPGITGLWQVSGRNDTDYQRRVALDVWYAQNWTIWKDVVILAFTVREVLAGKGAY